MKKYLSPSFLCFLLCCLFLLFASFRVADWKGGRVLTWDVSGYYLYLPGIFYDNLGELNNRQYIIDQYHPSGENLSIHRGPLGKYIIKYSSGMAVMYLPGFLVGHLYAQWGNYPVDGFSYPYQFSMAMYSLLIAFIGLWASRKLLLQYFSETVTALTLFSLVFATNYLNYAGISNMLTHNYLFTLYVLIIYLSSKWHEKYSYKQSAQIGLLCGLAALTRPTDVISIIIPILWGIAGYKELKARIDTLLKQYRKVAVLVMCAIAVGAIQLIYWKLNAGKFLYWSYDGDEKLNFLSIHFYNVLFSYEKGWFVYTPFMVAAIAGFICLFHQYRKLFWCSFFFFSLALYIVMSWSTWGYGGSFSMRAVVQYYAILIFPLASLIHHALKYWYTALSFFTFLAFCIWLNLVMTYQANCSYIMESNRMTKAYFWRIFGRLHIDKNDRKLIDMEEEMPAKYENGLAFVASENFTGLANTVKFEGDSVFAFDKETEFIPEIALGIADTIPAWYRAYAEVYLTQWEDNTWRQQMLYAWIANNKNEQIKRNSYRLHRVADSQRWDTVFIDIRVPVDIGGNTIRFGIYNPHGEKKTYIRKLWVNKVVE